MRTLRQQGEFVGLPQDSLEYGSPAPKIRLRLMTDLAAQANGGQPVTSMRHLDQILDGLPSMTLDAQLRSPGSGREPYELVIGVNPGTGLVISTRVVLTSGGRVYGGDQNFGAAGGDIRPTQLGPGNWTVSVRRRGVTGAGFLALEKSFSVRVDPRDQPNPPPPPPQQRPHISVTPQGPPEATKFVVTGTGFLPSQPNNINGIAIRVVDGTNLEQLRLFVGSEASGAINHTTGALDTTQLPRNAAGQAPLHFSATDKRTDPNSVPANEPLWSNTVTFTF